MNDAALLERWVQRQDAEAFNEIVSRFADQVYATCRNILRNDADAEEVAQECFLLLVRSGDDVRASLGGWLHRVATTKSLDRIRSEARRRKYEQAHAGETPHHTEATWDDIQEHVDAAIDTLPEELREAVVAHFIGRRTHLEIALELRVTRRAVSYRIQRGVEGLRAELVRRGVTVSCAGLGAVLLAEAVPAAPLSLKASLGKLALAAGLPSSSGAGAAAAVKTAGSLIAPNTKVLLAVAILSAALGVYIGVQPRTTPVESDPDAQTPRISGSLTPVSNPATAPRKRRTTPSVSTKATLPTVDVPKVETIPEEHRGVIRGVVLTPRGFPAQYATLRYRWEADPRVPSVGDVSTVAGVLNVAELTADNEGHFNISGIPRGRVSLIAEHERGIVTQRVSVEVDHPISELMLVLQTGVTISGVVIANNGSPVAGAQIAPLARDGNHLDSGEREFRAVTSDSSGAFALNHLNVGEWKLRVSAPQFGTIITEPILAGTPNARIVLDPEVTLACRVIYEGTGLPLGGVKVTVRYDWQRTDALSAKSDANGDVVFRSLGKGNYLVDIEDTMVALDGFPLPLSLDPARKPDTLIINAVDGGQIEGRVLDGDSRKCLPGLILRATDSSGTRVAYSSPTTPDGQYLISGLATGDYTVRPARLPEMYRGNAEPSLAQTVVTTAGRLVDHIDFLPVRSAEFGGVVVDTNGQPVAGARIAVRKGESSSIVIREYTREDGYFQFGGLKAGENVLIAAASNTGKSGPLGPFTAGDTGSDAIQVKLTQSCSGVIAGRVTDLQGNPYACSVATPELDEMPKSVMVPSVSNTDGLGNFVLTGLCPGTYKLVMRAQRGGVQRGPEIKVGQGEVVSDLHLIYDPDARFEIAGVVVDEYNIPMPGVPVNFMGESVSSELGSLTDEHGAFQFKGLQAGGYLLRTHVEGYSEKSMTSASAGTTDTVIRLMKDGRVSGKVSDSRGEAITKFNMILIPEDVPLASKKQFTISEDNGAFSVPLPVNGKWQLQVEAEGYAPAAVEVEHAATGIDLENVAITLEARK